MISTTRNIYTMLSTKIRREIDLLNHWHYTLAYLH